MKNVLLGLTPVFALLATLCEIQPVRITCAIISGVLFVTYVVLFIKNKFPKE